MGSYGLETYDSIGTGITVTADGAPKAKAGGITIAWSELTPYAADVTYESYDTVTAGEKYLRYGTILCRITAGTNVGQFLPYGMTPAGSGTLAAAKRGDWFILNESVHEDDVASNFPPVIEAGRVYKKRLIVEDAGGLGNETQTITITGTPTGGTFTVTFSGQTTSGIAYNASAATVQTALEALSNIAPGDVVVTGSAPAYTVKFAGAYQDTNVPQMTASGASLTGGSSPGVTVATTVTTGPPLASFETAFPMISYVTE